MTIVVAAVAGSVGALARYVVSGAIQRRSRSSLPAGTAGVNLLGAVALGILAGAGRAGTVWFLLGAGFLGGFTTFSTWMVETERLGLLPRPSLPAIINLMVMAVSGVAGASLGYHLAN